MGLVSWFNGLFKKGIQLSGISDDTLVAIQQSGKKVKFGTSLDVPQNFVCILVYKNKVADVFTEGRYRLDTNNMPLLTRMEKLTKTDKKGNLPKNFKADIYYVNLKQFKKLNFASFDYVYIKDKNYKGVNVKLVGNFGFAIKSPVDFMEAMFTSFGIVRDKIAKDEIAGWVGEIAVKYVQKKKPTVEKMYIRDTSCFEGLVDALNKELYDCGLTISACEITDVIFPKNVYKKISLSYDELHEKQQKQYVPEVNIGNNPVKNALEHDFENQSNNIYGLEAQKIEDEANIKQVVLEAPNNNLQDKNAEVVNNIEIAENVSNNFESAESDVQYSINNQNNEQVENIPSTPAQFGTTVTLTEDEQKRVEYKRCLQCGSYNSVSADSCFACGHKFKN